MVARKCLDEVLAAAEAMGMRLPNDEANSILDNMEGLIKRKNINIRSQSDLDLVINEALEMAKTAKIIASRRRNNILRNATIHAKTMNEVMNSKNPYETLRGMLVGSAKLHNMSSIDAKSRTTIADLQGQLLRGLEKDGLLEASQSGVHDKDVHLALHHKDGEPPKVSEDALKIAAVIRKLNNYALDRKNRAGAYISKIENYITRQSHDGRLMRRAGFDKWRDDIVPLLDDITFKNIVPKKGVKDAQEEFLRDIYESLISGVHKKSDGQYSIDGKNDLITAFQGRSNLAKSMSQSRVLHFKDGEASYQYSQKYNRRNLHETLSDTLVYDGRSIALMEELGTNPRAMIDRIINDIEVKTKSDPVLAGKRKGQVRAINREFAQLDNSLNAIGDGDGTFFGADFASVAAGVRMIQSMAMLGQMTVSSITDIASKAAVLSSNTERGFFHSFGKAMLDVLEGVPKNERKEIVTRLLVGVERMQGSILSRHGPEDFGPGTVSKMNALFYKLTGMRYWNGSGKEGTAAILAYDGAQAVKKPWADVDESFKAMLQRYKISEKEMALFKDVDMKAADGREYLFPDLTDDIPVDALDLYIREKSGNLNITETTRAKMRDELRTKVGSVYMDMADTAIPTPGAKEQAIMNLGYAKGTAGGEALRMFMMLKAFPITMMTKGLNRQYQTSGFVGVTKMIAGMSVMGYVAMSAKDILKGKEPRTIFSDDYMKSAKVVRDSMIQGGSLALIGDVGFGEFHKFGRSFTKAAAGPFYSGVDDVMSIFSAAMSGDPVAKQTVKFVRKNIPFSNLFYTNAALDYMVLHGLMETMQPGYLNKMERRYKKDYDQEFYFPPSSSAVRY